MMLLEPIQMPDNITVEEETYSSTYGKFEIGPMESGFATTIGNTLRRVLLSSIQGAAVRFVKIEGLHHEFTPIPGSTSDYVDLILKLKKLIFKMDSYEEAHLILEHSGKGIVTPADIQDNESCKVLNKDLELLEMTQDVDFRMELWVGMGRGYVPSDNHDLDSKPIGTIPVDSIYSPITKVNFTTGQQRVGQRIDFDKLIIEIWTDGSVDPKESLFVSAKLLKDLYAKLVQFEEEPGYIEEVNMDPELERYDRLFSMLVKDLELTVRSGNCLAAAKIDTVGELVSRSENEMLRYRNFGKKSLDEINALLEQYDLHLGMDVASVYEKINEAKSKVIKRKKG